jgi:hypothetical protein
MCLLVDAVPCHGWTGVTCDASNISVTGLNLTALGITVPSLPILKLISTIANLTKLETLILSNLGLTGPLDDPIQPNLGLHTFRQLRHLDISDNPGISSTLPSRWFELTTLQVLDISGSGIVGVLPALLMQSLRKFRAVNCTGMSGQLPREYGLLNLKVLQLTNTALTGTLPVEWASPAALRRMAAVAATTATTTARPASAADGLHVTTEITKELPKGDGGAVIGLQQLHVLDLSIAGGSRGGLSGSLPGSFAAMKQLQVWWNGWLQFSVAADADVHADTAADDNEPSLLCCMMFMRTMWLVGM